MKEFLKKSYFILAAICALYAIVSVVSIGSTMMNEYSYKKHTENVIYEDVHIHFYVHRNLKDDPQYRYYKTHICFLTTYAGQKYCIPEELVSGDLSEIPEDATVTVSYFWTDQKAHFKEKKRIEYLHLSSLSYDGKEYVTLDDSYDYIRLRIIDELPPAVNGVRNALVSAGLFIYVAFYDAKYRVELRKRLFPKYYSN